MFIDKFLNKIVYEKKFNKDFNINNLNTKK